MLIPVDGGWGKMLGISGLGCWLAYVFCILSALLCIVYGIVMWNRGGKEANETELAMWAEEQRKIEERF